MDMLRLMCSILIPCLAAAQTIDLRASGRFEVKNVKAEAADYRGRAALRLTAQADSDGLALLRSLEFQDGSIEVELAGAPGAGAAEAARGFIGVAFRVQPGGEKLECIYLRPTNGRADDQLRRNHSTQYVSHPDFTWFRLRKESPGLYESYVDLEPAAWTRYKIVVEGAKARLYVHGAAQPCLIVNDLKMGAAKGGVALWIGPGTVGHFSNLKIVPPTK